MRDDKDFFRVQIYTASGDGMLIPPKYNEDGMEFLDIREGKLSVRIGTELFSCSAGDILYIPPKTVFYVASEDGERATVRGMLFPASLPEEGMYSFDSEILYMFYVQSRNHCVSFGKGHPIYPALERALTDSYDENLAKDVCYRLPIRANIYLMMTALLRFYCSNKNESDRLVYHNVLRLRPVIEYISEHSKEKLYIEQLAGMISVSPDYFTKMFKDTMGKTPVDYINGERVNAALYRLVYTKDAMQKIADDVGFCNVNYFHRIFKSYIGMSPLAYRKLGDAECSTAKQE